MRTDYSMEKTSTLSGRLEPKYSDTMLACSPTATLSLRALTPLSYRPGDILTGIVMMKHLGSTAVHHVQKNAGLAGYWHRIGAP